MPAALDSQTLPSTSYRVECLSGHTYAGRPVALISKGQKRQIVEILTRWQKPGARCFRVRLDDGVVFELCYDETSDEWQVVEV
jgi:translation initiation factor IF-1